MNDPAATLTPNPLRIAFEGDALDSGEVVRGDLEQTPSESPLLALAASPDDADIVVEAQPNSIFRFYLSDRPVALAAFRIPVKKTRSLPRKVLSILEQIAAYRNLSQLLAPPSYITDVVTLTFVRLLEPATRGSTKEPEATPLARNAAGEYQLKHGDNLAITFTHRAPVPLYLYVVSMDSRLQSVGLVYPYRLEFSARIKPKDPVLLVGAGPEYLIQMQIPAGYPDGLDVFKVFVSTSAIEPDILSLPNLGTRTTYSTDLYGSGSRLDRDLRRVVLGQEGTAALPKFDDDPWWTMAEAIRIVPQ
jgi:hypothetical protein